VSNVVGTGKRVRVYIGEQDKAPGHHEPLWQTILDFLRKEGASGATMLRGMAGFGAHSKLHLARIADIAPDLPVLVEWIDGPERVDRLLPQLCQMVPTGTITLEDVQIVKYTHRQPRAVPPDRVSLVMNARAVSVVADAPIEQAARLLVEGEIGAVPVVDASRRVVGILTSGDLADSARAGTVQDSMTREVVCVAPDEPLERAAQLMSQRRVKRLPVVDSDGRLLGVLSSVDVLRTMGEDYHAPPTGSARIAGDARVVGDLVRHDMPALMADASLGEVLDAVTSTAFNRCVVVDADRRVIGIISDADLLGRLERRTAREVMHAPVITLLADMPVADAAPQVAAARHKILPITDADRRLVGAVTRSDVLRAAR
jgi:CBS domain-containing protein